MGPEAIENGRSGNVHVGWPENGCRGHTRSASRLRFGSVVIVELDAFSFKEEFASQAANSPANVCACNDGDWPSLPVTVPAKA